MMMYADDSTFCKSTDSIAELNKVLQSEFANCLSFGAGQVAYRWFEHSFLLLGMRLM